MKKILNLFGVIMFLILLSTALSFGQEIRQEAEICGFKNPSNREVDDTNTRGVTASCSPSTAVAQDIPIQFTVIRHSSQCDNDRYEITVDMLKNVVDEINKAGYYKKFNFINDFKLVGVKYVIDDYLSIGIPDASLFGIKQNDFEKLYDITPKNNAIQVCIVNTARSFALTPNFFFYKGINPYYQAHNNMIVLSEQKISKASNNTFKMELSHEIGHFFNLIHTHENTENKNSTSEFVDGTDNHIRGDKITDTPADPRADQCTYTICHDGKSIIVNGGCTEFDTNPNNPQKYNPDMFNIMGYYYPTSRCGGYNNLKNISNLPFSFSNCQFERMIQASNGNERNFLRTNPAKGFTVTDFHAGKILRAQCANAPISEPMNGKNVSITVAGTTPLTFTSTTNSCGRYYGQNSILVPNEGKQVNAKPVIDNTNYRENVNIADAFVLAFHIRSNGTFPTFTAYQKIAADVDNNKVLSFSDVRQIRDLALGRTTVFSAVNSWRYMPSYHESNVPDFLIANPFTHVFKNMVYPNYLDEAKLDYSSSPLDMALYETKAWSFSAIKMGDVSCTPSFQITEPELILLGDMLNSSTGVGVGTTLSVDVALNAAEDIDAYQFSIAAVPSLKIESVAIGDHFNNDMQDFFHLDEAQNALNHVWYSNTFATQHFPQGHALYRMKVKVVAPISSLENAFRINQTTVPAYRFGPQHRPMVLNLHVNNATYVAPETNENPLLLSVFPNPTSDKVTFSYKLNTQGNVTISISDNYGRVLQMYDMQGTIGWNEFTTASLNVTPGTILNYTVQSPEGTSRGRILTQE